MLQVQPEKEKRKKKKTLKSSKLNGERMYLLGACNFSLKNPEELETIRKENPGEGVDRKRQSSCHHWEQLMWYVTSFLSHSCSSQGGRWRTQMECQSGKQARG